MSENDRRPRRTEDVKRKLALAIALLICPGDDVAMIAAQLSTTMHSETPVAARIEQTAKVIPVFEAKKLGS